MFEVERSDGSAMPAVDVLACGNGQYGGLGNAQYSNAQSTPVRTKNISGLFECESLICYRSAGTICCWRASTTSWPALVRELYVN